MNTFGNIFRLTTFGESHGPAIGGIIDGMPAGLRVDFDAIAQTMARRAPGKTNGSTRKEADKVEFLSGIFEGRTLGTPIGFIIRNTDANDSDYRSLADVYRPNHADYTYDAKYGLRDYRGGGRASARETACRVVAGALAAQALAVTGINIKTRIQQIAGIECYDVESEAIITDAIEDACRKCDTIGGIIAVKVSGMPAGVGEPVFGKLQSSLAAAMMSIPAAKGFEYGDGFAAASATGSGSVDEFYMDKDGRIRTRSNHSGGIQGGISNGEDIDFRIAFKPIATMPGRTVNTVNTKGQATELTPSGRHDVCCLLRALPVVEAMTAITIFDAILLDRSSRL